MLVYTKWLHSEPHLASSWGGSGPWSLDSLAAAAAAVCRTGGRQIVLVLTPHLAWGIELQLEKLCLNTMYYVLSLDWDYKVWELVGGKVLRQRWRTGITYHIIRNGCVNWHNQRSHLCMSQPKNLYRSNAMKIVQLNLQLLTPSVCSSYIRLISGFFFFCILRIINTHIPDNLCIGDLRLLRYQFPVR